MLRPKPYAFDARPRVGCHDNSPDTTNCRSLVQDYFEVRYGVFLPRDAVEMPALWDRTGAFVTVDDGSTQQVARLPHESILLCEQIRNGHGARVDRSVHTFPDLDSYRMRLHTAVLLRDVHEALSAIPRDPMDRSTGDPLILHASAIAGGTALWSVTTLRRYYRVVAAKKLHLRQAPSE